MPRVVDRPYEWEVRVVQSTMDTFSDAIRTLNEETEKAAINGWSVFNVSVQIGIGGIIYLSWVLRRQK